MFQSDWLILRILHQSFEIERPKGLCQRTWYICSFCSLVHSLLPKDNLFKNIFDFTTAGDWDCVAAVERLPALHYSVGVVFLSIGIILEF